jgi:hypothetical protein
MHRDWTNDTRNEMAIQKPTKKSAPPATFFASGHFPPQKSSNRA